MVLLLLLRGEASQFDHVQFFSAPASISFLSRSLGLLGMLSMDRFGIYCRMECFVILNILSINLLF